MDLGRNLPADAAGRIDLATAAAVSGSYTAVSPMGLVWGAVRDTAQKDFATDVTTRLGGTPLGNAVAQEHSWRQALEFLERHLKRESK